MKISNIILFFLVATLVSCSKIDVPKETPKCIRKQIQKVLLEDVSNPPTEVYSYMYNDQLVYFFSAKCCDIPSELYDEDCNLICMPDGGITGMGDGNCTDFFGTRTEEAFVWRDTRI